MAEESTGRSGGTPPEDTEGNGGEYRGGPRMGTTVISGTTFTNKSVVYYDVEAWLSSRGTSPSAPSRT
jgi:hypothetical protein